MSAETTPDAVSAAVLWTVGHSTRPIQMLIQLLQQAGIELLADVRRHPSSRRHPQFAREVLAASLQAAEIEYHWLPELGGMRKPRGDSPNTGWRNDSFRGYADYMETQAFQVAVARLLELTRSKRTACMCAEQEWQQCHRGLLADYLKVQGCEVRHILSPDRIEPHPYTRPARILGGQLSYADPRPTQEGFDF
jgi:uncharacterized protein (DUF488 family)